MVAGTREPKKGEIILYKPKGEEIMLDVKLEQETVWLSLQQIADLFQVDKSGISRHIRNIFSSGELKPKTTVANFATVQKEGGVMKQRKVDYYNLDMIISVGYRVSSRRATQFRIWATNVLRQHLVQGYTLNHKRLRSRESIDVRELERIVHMVKAAGERRLLSGDEAKGLLRVIMDYADTWLLLQQYDSGQLVEPKQKSKTGYVLTHGDAQSAIRALKKNLMRRREASDLFGKEKAASLKGILETVEETCDGTQLEAKAAHLLYLVIKEHPFADGNKRIAAFLFILYLMRNGALRGRAGERKFNDNALVAIALLIAESDPKDKEIIITLIMRFIRSGSRG